MHAGVAPLLLRCSGSVPRSPSRHPAIVGFPQEPDRDAGGCRLLLEGTRLGEPSTPFHGVARAAGLHASVRTESLVRSGILPVQGTEPFDLGDAPLAGGPLETSKILRGQIHPY